MEERDIKDMCILIVDDVLDNQLLLESMLDDAGFARIETADSGQDALSLLQRMPVDLVLMDIMMPDLDGIETTRRIKQQPELADVPVIMVTAKSESTDLQQAFEAGAMDYVTKPVDELVLLARVRSALLLKRAMDQRKAREAELERSLCQIQRDLRVAARTQRGVLPAPNLRLPGLRAYWRFKPCDAVGGDLFNVFPLGRGRVGFHLFDVAGHGVPAAMYALSINSLFLSRDAGGLLIESDGRIKRPDRVMRALNAQFQMHEDTGQYFTCTYGVYDRVTRILQYTQAGHTPTLHASARNGVRLLRDGDMPVGLLPDAEYTCHELSLETGDRIVLYSDGIVEAENERGEQFGEQRLLAAVRDALPASLEASVEQVLEQVDHWLGRQAPLDDMTLLALEAI